MPRPLTRAQTLDNLAFLKALRRTGNVRLAAREAGVAYGTLQHRRAHHPAFATRWTAALAFADARLRRTGTHGPVATAKEEDAALRTKGGEPVVVRLKSGALQMRRAQPGKVTRQAEQGFLSALSATANIALAAAAVGVAQAAFFRRRRRNPAFAREMKAALAEGYEQLETALLASADPTSFEDDGWQHNDRPETPPMTFAQMLQLLYLHQKEVRLTDEPPHLRRRRGESRAAYHYRMDALGEAARAAEYERYRAREALFRDTGEMPAHAPPPPVLPDLAQVTGWSRADPAKGGHGDAALFGGWRIEHLTPEQRAAGRARRRRR